MGKFLLRGTAIAGAAALVVLTAAYRRDMGRAFSRVRGKSALLSTPYGDVEYSMRGTGNPVLVIHGSGGGYDQGELIAEVLFGDGYQSICPSRFGYLRSTFREGATFDDQAHAYVALLNHLKIEQVSVVAISHGGPSALLLALLYPERVSALALISAGVASTASQYQGQANRMGQALTTVFKHNWLYWGLTKLFKKWFMRLMGANPPVVASLTPAQQRLVARVIDEMNPVSLRTAGVMLDNRAALPGERIAGIKTPTLILHASDDTLQIYQNAVFAARTVPGSKLIRFKRGGHLLFAVEQEAVRNAVMEHINATLPVKNRSA
jgi:pimeloyl-ACP methyl ester carboxylesterase